MVSVTISFLLSMIATTNFYLCSAQFVVKLIASDGAQSDWFGRGVSIDGKYAIVGAYGDDDMGEESGSAYIFEQKDTNIWQETAKLLPNDDAAGDWFGYLSIAISGNYAIVGAHKDNSGIGSAYIFERDENRDSWQQTAKLIASDGASNDWFGHSVAIDGNHVIVGSYQDNDKGYNSGSAYIFERDTDTNIWSETQKITASDGTSSDVFGRSVGISNNFAIVGAPRDFPNGLSHAGAAYIYERNIDNNVWDQVIKLLPSDQTSFDYFGDAVAIHDNHAIVASAEKDSKSGAVYIFERVGSSNVWEQTSKLLPSDPKAGAWFGRSVAIYDDYCVIGAYESSSTGHAYIFHKTSSGIWEETLKIEAPDAAVGDSLGNSVGISGNLVIVGAEGDDDNGSASGAAYIFSAFSSDETTLTPTSVPTAQPSMIPTLNPTIEPTTDPSVEPTVEPTMQPTMQTTYEPTVALTTDTTFKATNITETRLSDTIQESTNTVSYESTLNVTGKHKEEVGKSEDNNNGLETSAVILIVLGIVLVLIIIAVLIMRKFKHDSKSISPKVQMQKFSVIVDTSTP